MERYEVKYGRWFICHKMKNIVEDGFIPDQPVRWFLLDDDTRVELPISMMFVFDKKRMDAIRKVVEEKERQQEHNRIQGK